MNEPPVDFSNIILSGIGIWIAFIILMKLLDWYLDRHSSPKGIPSNYKISYDSPEPDTKPVKDKNAGVWVTEYDMFGSAIKGTKNHGLTKVRKDVFCDWVDDNYLS